MQGIKRVEPLCVFNALGANEIPPSGFVCFLFALLMRDGKARNRRALNKTSELREGRGFRHQNNALIAQGEQ